MKIKKFLNLIEAFDEKIDYSNYNYYYTKYVLVEQKKRRKLFK